MFLMDLILGGHSRAATRRNTRSSRDPRRRGRGKQPHHAGRLVHQYAN
jgi:hypothetical protein